LRRAFEHGPAVVASPRLSAGARLDFVTYVGQLAVPPIVLGAAASAVVTGRRRALVSILGGYLGISALLGWDALRWESDADGGALSTSERLRRTFRVSLFGGLWLVAVPRALAALAFRRGPIRYVKMEHLGASDPESDSSAPGRSEA
jgi:hypothetical protein